MTSLDGESAPTARWIDSHCHIQDRYRPEEDELFSVLAEASGAGVGGVVCVGTDAATSCQAVDLVRSVRGALGSGPEGRGPGASGRFRGMGDHGTAPPRRLTRRGGARGRAPKGARHRSGLVVAVGECGFDYHYEHSPRAAQRDAFAAQVELARRHDLTLVVHSRAAWDDTLDVLRGAGPPQRTVLHCFTGGPDEARRCLDMGVFLSFSGIVTFKGAQDVRARGRVMPIRPAHGGDRRAVPGAGPASGQAEPAGMGRRRR